MVAVGIDHGVDRGRLASRSSSDFLMDYKKIIAMRFLNLEKMISEDIDFHNEVIDKNETNIREIEELKENCAKDIHIVILQRIISKCQFQIVLANQFLAGLRTCLAEVRSVKKDIYLKDGQIKVMQDILTEYETKSFCDYRKS